ncbi:oligo-1,6-glucosidase/alpha-glucosidase [Halanaerobium saccharolyticum]|uniref:Alpha-amylase n=1 Tax=Halanaerobium saccharolyticum TaxID=43595 RepID=A0A4R6RZ72_9FIRM|nr:alpha-glucosidase [Halanaerobium saccharolyticum]TDP92263.1 oligo-1,6-glucosidase/alpha-glucosidase [Halanaerobium saccharolyticum]
MTEKWWYDSVIYQIYPKSFNDSNNDGIGDLRGIIEKLDYLNRLGIDLIWLSPVFSSPMKDNGYDIDDYYAIAEQFGSMEDMEELIAEADKRGIGIMMDLVINHSSDQHRWFKESRKSKDNPKRDYYIWKEPKADGGPPTNWRSIFGGSAWTYDQQTEQYYLHTFAEEQPDLNWENKKLRQELYQMVNWWLDKGLAGFRVDAISYIKKSGFKDQKVNGPDGLSSIFEASANQPGILDLLNELKAETFSNYQIVTVAELYAEDNKRMQEFAGDDAPFDLVFDFRHVDLDLSEGSEWFKARDWDLIELKERLNEIQKTYADDRRAAIFWENHDQPRSLNKYLNEAEINDYSIKMLAAVFMLQRGIPFIYQGQEIGMSNVKFENIDDYQDLATHGLYQEALKAGYDKEEVMEVVWRRSRDNSRTPMQWSEAKNAGFSKTEPWLKVNPNYQEINVEENLKDDNSIFYFYKELIKLRKNSPYQEIIVEGEYQPILESDQNLIAYLRVKAGEKLLLIANFKNKKVNLNLEYQIEEIILSNYPNHDYRDLKNEKLDYQLNPFETILFKVE